MQDYEKLGAFYLLQRLYAGRVSQGDEWVCSEVGDVSSVS